MNPFWDETITICIQDITTDIVVIEVIDYDSVGKNDSLGFFALDLTKLPRGIEIITKENLYNAKHGTVQIGVTALDFGLVNFPPYYIQQYIQYRQESVGRTKEEIKSLVADYRKDITVGRVPSCHEGPFIVGKLHPPKGFKLRGGWLRIDKANYSSSHKHN